MKICPYCKSEIHPEAILCPHCRMNQNINYRKVVKIIGMVGILILLIIMLMFLMAYFI